MTSKDKQDEHNASSARGKQKPKKQGEHKVSSALHDVKTVLQLTDGKQSGKRIIADSEASFHWLSLNKFDGK